MTRRLAILLLVAAVAAVVVLALAAGPDLDQIALALALAGPACGAALASATGRPLLAASAMAGAGSYISAISSVRGVPVLLAIVCGCAGGAITGGPIGLVAARLDIIGFLIATIGVTLALGEGVQALHTVTGGQVGLGPLDPISVSLGGRQTLDLTPQGDFHLPLVVAVVIIGVSAILMRGRAGGRGGPSEATASERPSPVCNHFGARSWCW
jgi:ABC-type branched-subunit amino acid transport system permease subunit